MCKTVHPETAFCRFVYLNDIKYAKMCCKHCGEYIYLLVEEED